MAHDFLQIIWTFGRHNFGLFQTKFAISCEKKKRKEIHSNFGAFQFRPQRPVTICLSPGGEGDGGFWLGNQMVFTGNGGGQSVVTNRV